MILDLPKFGESGLLHLPNPHLAWLNMMPGAAPAGRTGDRSRSRMDAHGCVACPHEVVGPSISGSGNVYINGRGALRSGDTGVHVSCCGANRFDLRGGGSLSVFINGRQAQRKGDPAQHCGGLGALFEGSPDVFFGP